jgi:hypothetical protein
MVKVRLSRQKVSIPIALAGLLIYGSSLRPSFKYLDSLIPGIILVAAMTLLLVSLPRFLKLDWFKKLVASRISWLSVLFILAILTASFYPLADGLKNQMAGWDQDDCLKLGIENLLQGQNPYSDRSYLGHPCSPGFGAFVIYLPFVITGLFSMAPIVWLAVSRGVVGLWVHHKIQASLFFFVIASSPMTLELLVNGSDIVVLGLGLVLSSLGVQFALRKGGLGFLGMAAVLVGLVASMRVNFLLLVVVSTVFVFIRTKFGGMFFGLVASVVSTLPSALIYFSDPAGFTPLHLVGKSQDIVPPVLYVVMALLTVASLFIGALSVMRGKLDLVEFATLVFAPHIVFLSVSALVFGGWDFFNWEAGHYLYVLTPGLAYSVAKIVSNRSEAGDKNVRP